MQKLARLHLSIIVFAFGLQLAWTQNANAGTDILSRRTEVFNPSAETPDLKASGFTELKKRVHFSGTRPKEDVWLTDTRFSITSRSRQFIESTAIVQWIRGCLFNSTARHGVVSKSIEIYRLHFGHEIPFQHRTWQIDSDIVDPVYTAHAKYGRFALLRWNLNPDSLDPETSTWYFQKPPTHGSVFATDLPGGAFLVSGSGIGEGAAVNASLELQTCLFKTQDLPLMSDPDGLHVDRSRAIWCTSWDHKFVWDFNRGRMTRPKRIDPICGVSP